MITCGGCDSLLPAESVSPCLSLLLCWEMELKDIIIYFHLFLVLIKEFVQDSRCEALHQKIGTREITHSTGVIFYIPSSLM
jgi:hypothetical protein